jgi:hypothetical protein
LDISAGDSEVIQLGNPAPRQKEALGTVGDREEILPSGTVGGDFLEKAAAPPEETQKNEAYIGVDFKWLKTRRQSLHRGRDRR